MRASICAQPRCPVAGVYLGAAFPLHEAKHGLYPSVGVDTVSILAFNFGATQFEFDLNSFEETESLQPHHLEAVQSEVALSLAHQAERGASMPLKSLRCMGVSLLCLAVGLGTLGACRVFNI